MDSKQIVFRTEWFSIEQEAFDSVEWLKGKPYYRINSPNGVLVLALTETNEIILIKQFRPALSQHTLEFPSGSIDEEESPKEAAARELYEETGYKCASLDPLGVGRVMMNRNNSRQFAFFGTGAVKDPNFAVGEDIEVVLAKPAELKSLAVSGQFEQLAALGLLVLADWQFGSQLTCVS